MMVSITANENSEIVKNYDENFDTEDVTKNTRNNNKARNKLVDKKSIVSRVPHCILYTVLVHSVSNICNQDLS